MEDSITNTDGRRMFTRVIVNQREDKYYARLTGAQGSGILTSMVRADGLAIIPENTEEVKSGTIVEVLMLN